MKEKQKQPASFQPDRILSYFKAEWKVLLAVTISGLIYNVGLLAGPWFEGKMTGCLVDILRGAGQFGDMLILVLSYVAVIVIVQSSRYIKRFYVRRFANNVNRRMKEILYGHKPGDTVKITYERGGQTKEADVTLQAGN